MYKYIIHTHTLITITGVRINRPFGRECCCVHAVYVYVHRAEYADCTQTHSSDIKSYYNTTLRRCGVSDDIGRGNRVWKHNDIM